MLICDLDGTPGRGTAAIFQNEPRVVTFSMHASPSNASGSTSDRSTYEVTCPVRFHRPPPHHQGGARVG